MSEALWRQFGAAIDMLDSVVVACPDDLWTEKIWPEEPPEWFPSCFAEFWYVTYHTLVWLDIYSAGLPEEQFAPPAPFRSGELDSPEAAPAEPYTKEVLRSYLASLRARCRDAMLGLTEAEAARTVEYAWCEGVPVTMAELHLYNLRHLAGHAAQLSLFLGQHGVPGEQLDWAARAG